MRCEVCGGEVHGKLKEVLIEGTVMRVCPKCERHGTIYQQPRKIKPTIKKVLERRRPLLTLKPAKKDLNSFLEVIKDYNLKVRGARERIGLTHDDLGRKIGEKASVLKRIEAGKMVPDIILAKKLEHALQIKLLTLSKDYEFKMQDLTSGLSSSIRGLTLGEVAEIRRRKEAGKNEGSHSSKTVIE